jgi:hypothetical protein
MGFWTLYDVILSFQCIFVNSLRAVPSILYRNTRLRITRGAVNDERSSWFRWDNNPRITCVNSYDRIAYGEHDAGTKSRVHRGKCLSRSTFLIIYRKLASFAKFLACIYDIASSRNTSQTTFMTLLSSKPCSNLARVASIMINSRGVPVAEYRSLHKSAGKFGDSLAFSPITTALPRGSCSSLELVDRAMCHLASS